MKNRIYHLPKGRPQETHLVGGQDDLDLHPFYVYPADGERVHPLDVSDSLIIDVKGLSVLFFWNDELKHWNMQSHLSTETKPQTLLIKRVNSWSHNLALISLGVILGFMIYHLFRG